MTAGTIVLAYNVDGVDDLKLSQQRPTLASSWERSPSGTTRPSPPPIPASNSPATDDIVVVRADSSGTTYVLHKHLEPPISEAFAANPGIDKQPNWPVGTKSKGNEGVSTSIKTTPNSIGYIEYVYAKGAKLKNAKLENKAGKFVDSTPAAAQAALASAQLSDEMIAWVPDPAADDAYPIVTYTWIVTYRKYLLQRKANTAIKEVLAFCPEDAQQNTGEKSAMGPLPAAIIEANKAALNNITSDDLSPSEPAADKPNRVNPPRQCNKGRHELPASVGAYASPATWRNTQSTFRG